MINVTVNQNDEKQSERMKAVATARMIYYAANDSAELGMKDCSQLLNFVADLIKIKFKIEDGEMLMEFEPGDTETNMVKMHDGSRNK